MAETTTPKTLTREEAIAKLDKLTVEAMAFSGKPGVNPHLWIANTVAPLRDTIFQNKDAAAVAAAIAKVTSMNSVTEATVKI